MVSIRSSTNFVDRFPSLSLAIAKLFDKQEKDWGYFQVKKEEDRLYYLYIPSLPGLKFYQNPDKHIYRAFWGDNKNPAVSVKKKQRKVYHPDKPRLEKKQRIYEVVYQYDSRTEIHAIAKILADLIRDKIKESISFVPEDEVMPLVIVTEEMS
ncbi:hypothetical protein IQ238_19740 [Pleurocapsales cyanobacterium LEGE 06147]|nr:hypothetical protein [Pleurocapsales cyanobacterium LEGE 06147]